MNTIESVEYFDGVGSRHGYVVTGRIYDESSDFEYRYTDAFVVSAYSGDVSWINDQGKVTQVLNPGRFGMHLNHDWLKRFYGVN